jgi:hypothetical protein
MEEPRLKVAWHTDYTLEITYGGTACIDESSGQDMLRITMLHMMLDH